MESFEGKVKKYLNLLSIPFDSNFDEDDVLNNYRMLAKIYHPDKQKVADGNKMFIAITEAKEFIINNYSSIKTLQNNFKYNFNDELNVDATNEKLKQKNNSGFKFNIRNFGIIAIIIGAVIHFSSSFVSMLYDIVILDYLITDNINESGLYDIWFFTNQISFLGYIFYYFSYYIIFSIIEIKIKKIFYVILGINIFVNITYELSYFIGVSGTINEIFYLSFLTMNIILCLYFILILQKLDKRVYHKNKFNLVLYAFLLDFILSFLGLLLVYLNVSDILYYCIRILMDTGYIVANLFFLIFAFSYLYNTKREMD